MFKARSWTVIFRNRRIARRWLLKMCKTYGITYCRIPLDQKTRWSSTEYIISIFQKLKQPIQAVLGTQDFDKSLKALNLDNKD
jgi:hypothetical protein